MEASWSCWIVKKLIKTTGCSTLFKLLAVCFKWLQVGLSWPQVGSSWPQVGSSWPQVGPRWPHVASSWPKLASSWLKLAPSWLQVGSSWAQDKLREPPGGSPEGSWKGPGTVLRGTWSQEALREAPEVPKWCPDGSKIHEKSIKSMSDLKALASE